MRIIILSIALLFCALSAHSQVLKSAGVWYFLDVDSMTARPAVLPNGTELAYVVGTKTVYYWNRNTSTWTAYGSTFNRDSIYFDASIVGSGTVSDPWGVDSTLFATIQAVGDSILANKQTLFFDSGTGDLSISDGNNVSLLGILNGYTSGTGTVNRVPVWNTSTSFTNSNIQDNGTAVSILSSKPFQLGQWTTAGRPSGTDGYKGRNTTTGFDEGYFISQWRNYITSTGATDGQVSIFSSAGQTYGTNNLLWDNTNKYLYINTPTPPSPIYHLNITSTGTISQRWLGMFNSSNIIQSAFTSDGSGNGGIYVYNNAGTLQGRFSSGDISYLIGKVAFGVSVPGTADFLVQHLQTDIGLNARINIGGSGGGFPGVGYNVQLSSSANTYTKKSTGVSYFLNFGTSGRFSINTSPSAAAGSTITWTEALSVVNSTNFIGINQTNPQRRLDVNGEARIADLTTDTPTRIVGADGDGDLGAITVSTGLDLTSGVLTATGASTWLKTELEASRDVTINGGSSTDFRIQNTRIQFDVKTKIGSDSSFVHDPAVDTTRILGTSMFGKASTLGSPTVSGYPFIFRNPSSSSTYVLIESGRTSPSAGAAGIRLLPSGNFTSIIEYGTSTGSALQFSDKGSSKINFQIGSSQFVTGNRRTVIVGSDDPTQWGANGTFVIYDTITTGKAMFLAKKVASSSTPLAMFSSAANDRFTFNDDGTTRFHVYGTPATTAAALSKTLSNYGVGFATDGTVTSREIKRDTTIYINDSDYDFSAALTTAQVAARYNRVVFLMTTTAAAGSNSDLTLHTPDANLMQVEYLIRSTDETGGFTNVIQFGSNNAVDSGNALTSSYTPSPGQGVGMRAGLRSSVYKYWYY